MGRKDQLEPLEDGWVAFHSEDGERWRHKDLTDGRVGEGERVFLSESGKERRYRFAPDEPHDATIEDLRDQLRNSREVESRSGDPRP